MSGIDTLSEPPIDGVLAAMCGKSVLDSQRMEVTMPMGRLVSPLIGSLGNVEMPIVKKADMNDSGRNMIVTIVKTRTIQREVQLNHGDGSFQTYIALLASSNSSLAGLSRFPYICRLLLEIHERVELLAVSIYVTAQRRDVPYL
jgi:hypothetical protein